MDAGLRRGLLAVAGGCSRIFGGHYFDYHDVARVIEEGGQPGQAGLRLRFPSAVSYRTIAFKRSEMDIQTFKSELELRDRKQKQAATAQQEIRGQWGFRFGRASRAGIDGKGFLSPPLVRNSA